MKTKLLSIVNFVAVPAGGSVSLPHGLNLNDGATLLVPDEIKRRTNGNFTIAADDTNVTVVNKGGDVADIDVLCEHWYSSDRALGVTDYGQSNLSIQPWESTDDGVSLTSAVSGITWRNEAVGVDVGENVYGTWEEVYAAIKAVRSLGGNVVLWFDASKSTDVTPTGTNGMMIPGGTALNGADWNAVAGQWVWDMNNVVWNNVWDAFGQNDLLRIAPNVYFEDTNIGVANCYIDNLAVIECSFLYMQHDGTVHTPIRGNIALIGERPEPYNTDPAALPMFEAEIGAAPFTPYNFIIKRESHLGGTNQPFTEDGGLYNLSSPAPLVDFRDSFGLLGLAGGQLANNVFTQDPAVGFVIAFVGGGQGGGGLHNWEQPGMIRWVVDTFGVHGNSWNWMYPFTWTAALDGQILGYNEIYTGDTSVASGGNFSFVFPLGAGYLFGDPITVTNEGTEGVITCVPSGTDTIQDPYVRAGQSKTWRPNAAGEFVLVAGNDLGRNMNAVALVAQATAEYGAIVLVDSSGGAFILDFPPASRYRGEPITVVGIGGGANLTTCTPAGGDTIDNATIADGERKTYAPDGVSAWRQIA